MTDYVSYCYWQVPCTSTVEASLNARKAEKYPVKTGFELDPK
jgi:hypothetical protein